MATTSFPRALGILAVGVDDCGLMQKLSGASKGADLVCEWARGQHNQFGITLVEKKFTDQTGQHRLSDIQDAALELVQSGLDILIVYLSGHGVVKAGDDEHLLLWGAQKSPTEAVSVASTIAAAWLCGVPHVVIVSDACRSSVLASTQAGRVVGAPILTRAAGQPTRAKAVDVFYAAGPFEAALEVDGDGLLTSELCKLLCAPEPDYVQMVSVRGVSGFAVVPTPLSQPLAEIIERRAAELSPPRTLQPDFRVTSGPYRECFLGLTDRTAPRGDQALKSMPTVVSADAKRGARVAMFGVEGNRTPLFSSVSESVSPAEEKSHQFDVAWRRLSRRSRLEYSEPREPIREADAAVLIAGAHVESVAVHESAIRISRRADGVYFQLPESTSGATALFALNTGTTAVVPILRSYTALVTVEDGRVQSLAYRPAWRAYAELELTSIHVFAESVARRGELVRLASKEANRYGDWWRERKELDPMLGVFAAYAYSMAGNIEEVESVFDWLSGYSRCAVPFDVAMLAGKVTRKDACRSVGFAPFCPILTLGWSMASGLGLLSELHPAIRAAGERRLNSLYTTFRTVDLDGLRLALTTGELR